MLPNAFSVRTGLFTFFTLLTVCLAAQPAYTVHAGVFRSVGIDDFRAIRDLGFVYDVAAGKGQSDVYVGQFSTRAGAETALETLRERGFRNARLVELPDAATAADRRTLIQIATHARDQSITWKTYLDLGSVAAYSLDGTTKILLGPYPDEATARAALPELRNAGYKDAFLRHLPANRIIPIDAFETGIKQPLIPITYSRPSVVAADAPTEAASAPPPPPGPKETPVAAPVPASTPAATPAPAGSSIAELQTVLRDEGFYAADIDGLYGPATAAGLTAALRTQPDVLRYRTLLGADVFPEPTALDSIGTWPETRLLLAVSEDLSAGNTNAAWSKLLQDQRRQLFAAEEALNEVAAVRTRDWAATVFDNLDAWAAEDSFHEAPYTVFRLTYHATQMRLERHYTARGLAAGDARDLAVAAMQNLTGAQLDRFL